MTSEKPQSLPRHRYPPRKDFWEYRLTRGPFHQPTAYGPLSNSPGHYRLYNPRLDPRDLLVGSATPRQPESYTGQRYRLGTADRATAAHNRKPFYPSTGLAQAPPLRSCGASVVPRKHSARVLRSTLTNRGPSAFRLSDACQADLRRATTTNALGSKPGLQFHGVRANNQHCAATHPKPALERSLSRHYRSELRILPADQRKDLFEAATYAVPAALVTPQAQTVVDESPPARSTIVIRPTQTAFIQVADESGAGSFVVSGSGFRRVTVSQPDCQSASALTASRKRRAEDSELDLVLANTVDLSQPGHSPSIVEQRVGSLNLDEQGVDKGRAAWLASIMTSVRGAVNKVSYSIAGFVHAHDYNVVERHSRNQENGDIITKRIKLDSDVESNKPAAHQESHQVAVVSSSHRANLVWIDESTRVAHWHQIAVLVRALKDLSKNIQKGQGRNETGLPGPQPDDDRRSPRLYHLRVHLGTFQQTAAILESIYSHTFLARLKEKFTFPQTTMDYETSPGEHLAIASAKVFLDNPPKECFSALFEAGVTPRVIKGVSADLGAIASQMPMPGLVQRAGFVGKVIKFFRGRDSFGCDASDDVVDHVDTKMPGSFPDTQPKSGLPEEEASNARVESEERIRKKKETSRSYTPVAQTDTYSYIKDHLAEMETKVKSSYRDKSSQKGSQGAPPKPISTIATKKDGQLSPALKRLQKSRYMKRVHFSPSAKQPSPSPMRPAGFLSKIFRSRGEIAVSSPLRHFGSERPLGDAQTDGSLDSRNSKDPDQELGSECQADDASGDGSDVDVIDKCKTRLVRHLNESLKEREASRSSDHGEPPAPIGNPLGLPELDGLKISDDKEGELDDLSAALQLMLDEGEARQREEEARKAKEAEQEQLRKTGGLRIPRKRLVTSLPSNWIARVQSTTRAPPNQVLTQTAESVDLRRHDFLKVVPPTEWLNDEIVNGSLQWLDRYVNEAAGAPEVRSTKRVCLAMNSFFYKRLEDSGVQNTERALRRFGVSKTNFLNLETILMPICKNNHWTLLVVRPQKRTVSHMDSLNPRGSAVHTKRALDWIKALLGDDFKTTEWQTVQHQAPVQDNGYDCGVFTITNGMCLALGLNAADAYSNEELPLQRLRIAGMLLNKGFSGEFDLAGL